MYYRIKTKKIIPDPSEEVHEEMGIDVPNISDDIEYTEIHNFFDDRGIVIETSIPLIDFLEEYTSISPIIKSHKDWLKKEPKAKILRGKIKQGKFIRIYG